MSERAGESWSDILPEHARYSDVELVRRAVASAGDGDELAVRWSHVARAFSLGSTVAYHLCKRFGLDPDEMVGCCDE